MKMREERDGFRHHMEKQRRARATVQSYVESVELFLGFMQGNGIEDARAVSPREVDLFAASLAGRGLAVQTQRTRLRAIKRFFEYLMETGKLFSSPAEHLRDPKEHRAPTPPLSPVQVESLLAAPDVRRPSGVRDRALLELLRSTGLGRNEVCGLMVYDLDLDGGQLRVRSMTNGHERLVPFDQDAQKWLGQYVKKVRPRHSKHATPAERHLFVTTSGKPLSTGTLWGILHRYRAETGIRVSCMAFRRTARAQRASLP